MDRFRRTVKALSSVEIVVDRFRSVGYTIEKLAHREGLLLRGVPDWTIVWTDNVEDPEQVLGRLGPGFSCVLSARRGRARDVQALLWTDELALAVERIREGATENARLAAGAHDLLSKEDLRVPFVVAGRRGCRLALADWTFLLLGWRLALRRRRSGYREPIQPDGDRIGRYIVRDYNNVRAGQLCEELDYEVAVHGHPLISSPMGLSAPALSSSAGVGFSSGVSVHLGEEQPVGERQEGGRDEQGSEEGRKRGRGRGHVRVAKRGSKRGVRGAVAGRTRRGSG